MFRHSSIKTADSHLRQSIEKTKLNICYDYECFRYCKDPSSAWIGCSSLILKGAGTQPKHERIPKRQKPKESIEYGRGNKQKRVHLEDEKVIRRVSKE